MTKQELFDRLITNNLHHHIPNFEPLLRNCIRLQLQPIEEDQIFIGQSKIGGLPDLPADIVWPNETVVEQEKEKVLFFFSKGNAVKKVKPLSFIAQINLEEVASCDTEELLPKSGMLYFFYNAEQDAWGFDPNDKQKFKVLYWNGDLSDLNRIPYPDTLGDDARFKAAALFPRQEISLPSMESGQINFFTEEEEEVFHEEVLWDGEINKMLGYADSIQNEMELECELVTNGLYCGDPSGYSDPRAKGLEANAHQWRLLLQVDSNDGCDMMWGDAGRLFFWIRKQDLLEQRWDRSWFSLQCY